MSFEELITKAKKDVQYEQMKLSLCRIVTTTPDLAYVASYIEPFLQHVDSQSLTAFQTALHISPPLYVTMPGIIHNMVLESRTNQRLYKVLDVLIRTFMI